jgi:uncharacterized Tic20 family protein
MESSMSQFNGVVTPEATRTASLAHIVSLVGMFFCPVNLIAPLVIMFVDKTDFGRDQAAEAFNFQLSYTVWTVFAAVLCLAFVGFILLPIVLVMNFVLPIIAASKARRGIAYRYPFTFRVL